MPTDSLAAGRRPRRHLTRERCRKKFSGIEGSKRPKCVVGLAHYSTCQRGTASTKGQDAISRHEVARRSRLATSRSQSAPLSAILAVSAVAHPSSFRRNQRCRARFTSSEKDLRSPLVNLKISLQPSASGAHNTAGRGSRYNQLMQGRRPGLQTAREAKRESKFTISLRRIHRSLEPGSPKIRGLVLRCRRTKDGPNRAVASSPVCQIRRTV